MRYFSCRFEEEYYSWLRGLNSCVHCNRDLNIRLDTSLSVWIFEAKGVPVRKKYFCEIIVDKILFSRTTSKYKDEMLFWGEQFSFDDLPPTESLTISLFRESDTKKKRRPDKNVFIGSAVIDLVNFETNTEIERWVSIHVPGISPKLQQKGSGSNKNDFPSIRTKLKYETHVILPLTNYQDLYAHLIDNYLNVTSNLENSINLKTKDQLAQALLKILIPCKKAEGFLVDIIMNEVRNTTDENLTFRGNSLATKSIDTYMKMIGKKYIQETLTRFISSVYELEGDTEVDPQKLVTPNSSLSENQRCLLKLVEECWRSIFLSIQNFPKNLQLVFSMVRKQCDALERDIVKKIVSASLFLRLLCPAILSPSLFLLTPEYPNEKVSRALTLVAKTIQNLANFTRFGSKESYMEILNEFVEREMVNMDNFLQRISFEPDHLEESDLDCPACVNIDVARELSVVYHLLAKEIPNLPPSSVDKLKGLPVILNEIQQIYDSSPKVEELRLCRPFDSVALVCSKPLVTPSCPPPPRDETPTFSCGETTPVTPVDDEDEPEPLSYLETSLNLTEDFGTSNLETNCDALNEHILIRANTAPGDMLNKNTFLNSPDVKSEKGNCKCDKVSKNHLDVKRSKDSKIKSPFTVRKMKQENRKKRSNSRDEEGRANAKDEEDRFAQQSVTQDTYELDVHSYDTQKANQREHKSSKNKRLDVFQKKLRHKNRGSPLLLNFQTNNEVNALPSDDVRVCRKSSSDDDDGDLTLDDDSSEGGLQVDSETIYKDKMKDTSYHDRTRLQLHSLQKDHGFLDELSPNSKGNANKTKTDHQSNFHNASCPDINYRDALFDGSNRSPKPRSATPTSSQNRRYNSPYEPSPRRLSSERWRGSLDKGDRKTLLHNQKTYENEKNNRDVDSNPGPPPSSNGFLDMSEQTTISSCSSHCTCSSESYYSDDDDYGTVITGDRLPEELQVSTQQHSITHGHTNFLPGFRRNSTNNLYPRKESEMFDNPSYDSDNDATVLKRKLRESEGVLRKTQRELKTRSENFEQTVIRLKDKLIEADKKMKAQRLENETQMKNVISRLLNVEAELRNEHAEMEAVIKGKQKMIEIQDKRIKSLEGSNIRLLRALSNMKRNHSRQEDKEIDDLLACFTEREGTTSREKTPEGENGKQSDADVDDV